MGARCIRGAGRTLAASCIIIIIVIIIIIMRYYRGEAPSQRAPSVRETPSEELNSEVLRQISRLQHTPEAPPACEAVSWLQPCDSHQGRQRRVVVSSTDAGATLPGLETKFCPSGTFLNLSVPELPH